MLHSVLKLPKLTLSHQWEMLLWDKVDTVNHQLASCFSQKQLAKAEKLKPMEVELKRLEDLGDAIVNDFAYMRQREQEMRDTNGKELELAF